MIFYSAYIYGGNFMAKIWWGNWFSKGGILKKKETSLLFTHYFDELGSEIKLQLQYIMGYIVPDLIQNILCGT